MKRIVIFLLCFMIFAPVCFAEKQYFIDKQSVDELTQVGKELSQFTNQLLELRRDLTDERQIFNFLLIEQNIVMQQSLIYSLLCMLDMENFHNQSGQSNQNAIRVVNEFISKINESINSSINDNNLRLRQSQSTVLNEQYNQYYIYLSKVKNILYDLGMQLARSLPAGSRQSNASVLPKVDVDFQ
ncbi:MAG: hypothetical protein KJ923_05290 [Candidatus Omnitrophica bacterium]|nr:hypothetical protein [Candidatus Omnitrophota bacterium]